ncbi:MULTISPECIES: hypothetical protein [unclassified Hydrogenobaculum]|uniref:hypothetical protein n=1 Tax=unclassified Hydrogenobaculum TaxID=2622382 RepID=UPI0001C50302|nr:MULTISPECIES: hypothetical protein [unclassified Hydrogenobaculum]AEF19281.1 hypothetical protein Hyd3684_0891 [Hydrogenobaculum sp. 3684]AEG46570.1 hypothetical protein HydSHO_0892 [Hydrogenobaculum sp. SHO]AGG15215.1 hypothetical protein HydHO_0896 [Hydrogenobaculum sp. HO]AGH93513.1 hypothetical protein HydSN_0919 [Hydrogenobaculum sp. SN]
MNSMSIWEIFKSLFDYTQAFITKKPGPVIIYITLLLIFVVADNYLPMNLVFVSVFASIFWNILSNAFLINVGHIVKDNKDIISFEKALKQRNTIDFFTQYWKESLGMMFGNAVVFFIIFLGEALVLNFSGFLAAYYATKNHDIFAINYTVPIALALIFVITTLSMISYVAPYVYAGVYTTDSFKEAFARVFDLISFGVWKKTLNLQYFFDISMWFVYSTMVIVMIIPLMFYAIVAPFGLIVLAIYIIQFPMFSVMIRYWR